MHKQIEEKEVIILGQHDIKEAIMYWLNLREISISQREDIEFYICGPDDNWTQARIELQKTKKIVDYDQEKKMWKKEFKEIR